MMRRWRCLTVVAALAGGLVVAPVAASAAPPAANPAPDVVPSLQQWTGASGRFEFGPQSRIVVTDPALVADARTFAGDLATLADLHLPVVTGRSSHPGDVVLGLGASGLPAQGYTLDIGDTLTISAVDATGAFYGQQTVEQL